LLGLVGGLAAAAGLAAAGSTPAEALPLPPAPARRPEDKAEDIAEIRPEDLDGVRTEEAQYWYRRRRRYYRRYYWRPRRRYYRRYRRYYRRRYW
jgi:hypothetical protein